MKMAEFKAIKSKQDMTILSKLGGMSLGKALEKQVIGNIPSELMSIGGCISSLMINGKVSSCQASEKTLYNTVKRGARFVPILWHGKGFLTDEQAICIVQRIVRYLPAKFIQVPICLVSVDA